MFKLTACILTVIVMGNPLHPANGPAESVVWSHPTGHFVVRTLTGTTRIDPELVAYHGLDKFLTISPDKGVTVRTLTGTTRIDPELGTFHGGRCVLTIHPDRDAIYRDRFRSGP